MRRLLYSETSHAGTSIRSDSGSHRTMKIIRSGIPIFSVQLVMEGGPVTLKQAEHSIQDRQPVVVMEGSGRMANVISYAWRYLHDTSPRAVNLSLVRHVDVMRGERYI